MVCISTMDAYACDISMLATISACDHYGIVRAITLP